MNQDIFNIKSFNVISDENNYYFFRALNMGDINDKREEIINELLDLIRTFYKINKDFNVNSSILPIVKNEGTEEEFLTRLCSCILSLKEVSADTIKIMLDNLYE